MQSDGLVFSLNVDQLTVNSLSPNFWHGCFQRYAGVPSLSPIIILCSLMIRYDKVDMEFGGQDQKFNLLGAELQTIVGQRQQQIFTSSTGRHGRQP
jgi:hypothetical protein